ncbi:unnamed protein product, partial [marine sediment metagenome]
GSGNHITTYEGSNQDLKISADGTGFVKILRPLYATSTYFDHSTTTGSMYVGGILDVTGNVVIGGTLDVTGQLTSTNID